MPLAGMDLCDFATTLAQPIDIILGSKPVGDNPVNRRRRCDERKTPTTESAGTANHTCPSSTICFAAVAI